MGAPNTVSITLPPEVLVKAREVAKREHLSIDELLVEALRHYIENDAEWRALLKRTRATGRKMDIKSEADVERLSDEFRRERRK